MNKNPLLQKIVFFAVVASILVLYLLNASRPGRAAVGCPVDCTSALERRPGPLRILSLNMLHGFPDFEDLPSRLDLIASEIRRTDADVVLLQEVPWTIKTGNAADTLSRQLGYNDLYFRANGNRWLISFEEGEAVLSRFPLSDVVFSDLSPRAGFFENRIVLGAVASTPWGEVPFFVSHLSHSNPQANALQAESLSVFVEQHTNRISFVAGDFNAREDSPQITALNSRWIDAYRRIHPNDEGLTCCIADLHAGPGEPLEKRIDYLFLVEPEEETGNGGVAEIVSARTVFDQPFQVAGGWQWASDHAGLLVEIRLSN